MSKSVRVLASLVCSTLFLTVASAQAPGETAATAAARKRQAAVRSLDVSIELHQFVAAGSISAVSGFLANPRDKSAKPEERKPAPEAEVNLDSTSRLAIRDNWYRMEEHHPIFDTALGKYRPHHSITTFGGEVKKTMYFENPDQMLRGQGILDEPSRAFHSIRYSLAPITLSVRGTGPPLSGTLIQEYRPTGSKATIQGRPCEEYTCKLSVDSHERAWVDPGQGYAVRRLDRYGKDSIQQRTDVEYRFDEGTKEWFPSEWVITKYGKAEKVWNRTTVKVTEWKVNPDLPAETFDIRFPPGLSVADNRNHFGYRVTDSGTLEQVDSYGNIVGPTLFQPGTSFWRRYRWWLILVAVASLFIGWRIVSYKLGRKSVSNKDV